MTKKIYCAGPMFNPKEREEMEEIAGALEDHGFNVFLPHRDGLELAAAALPMDVFELDIAQILESDGLVLNMNGRVPDEGAAAETGIAWQAGKKIVIYKNDTRTLIDKSDNPILVGLANYTVISDISKIPHAFNRLFGPDENMPSFPGF